MSGEKSVRILVADDNATNQRVITGMLEHQGYEVRSVSNGGEVIGALETSHFDLVIMDCLMPVMDGYEATRTIRASRSAAFDPRIPVLAITALAAPGDREKCLESGMNDYISKPVVAKRLFQKLHDLLGAKGDGSQPNVPGSTETLAGILQSLTPKLLADLANWRFELAELRAEGPPSGLGRLAHKIRGSADVFGAAGLSRAAARLETCVREGEVESLPRLTTALADELLGLEQRLRSRL
jgi:hypothetical protein